MVRTDPRECHEHGLSSKMVQKFRHRRVSAEIVVTGIDDQSPMNIPVFAEQYNRWIDLLSKESSSPPLTEQTLLVGGVSNGDQSHFACDENGNVAKETAPKKQQQQQQLQDGASPSYHQLFPAGFHADYQSEDDLLSCSSGLAAMSVSDYASLDAISASYDAAENGVEDIEEVVDEAELPSTIDSTKLSIELMKSDESDFETTPPGWPFCRDWIQSKNFVKFVLLFPNCNVTAETTSVNIGEDNYCLVRCEAVDGTENHWGTRLWRTVVRDATVVQVKDGEVHVQCQKEDVGLRWEKVGTARTRRF